MHAEWIDAQWVGCKVHLTQPAPPGPIPSLACVPPLFILPAIDLALVGSAIGRARPNHLGAAQPATDMTRSHQLAFDLVDDDDLCLAHSTINFA